MRAFLLALVVVAALPSPSEAQGERVMVGIEGALLVPTESPSRSAFAPGATASLAAHFSLTNWLMPLVRARAGVLGVGQSLANPDGSFGTLGALMGGVRFRPRGIAHPEESSRAACVWAEIDAGLALFGGRPQPAFEAAVGFLFVAGDVDLGPAIRFAHVMPASPGDPTDTFFVTVGLEILLGDAR